MHVHICFITHKYGSVRTRRQYRVFYIYIFIAHHPPNPDSSPRMGGPDCVYKKYRPGARTKSLSSSTISGPVILSTSAKSRKKSNAAPKRQIGEADALRPSRALLIVRIALEAAARRSIQHGRAAQQSSTRVAACSFARCQQHAADGAKAIAQRCRWHQSACSQRIETASKSETLAGTGVPLRVQSRSQRHSSHLRLTLY